MRKLILLVNLVAFSSQAAKAESKAPPVFLIPAGLTALVAVGSGVIALASIPAHRATCLASALTSISFTGQGRGGSCSSNTTGEMFGLITLGALAVTGVLVALHLLISRKSAPSRDEVVEPRDERPVPAPTGPSLWGASDITWSFAF